MILKNIHIICAYVTGIGFLLRGILLLMNSPLSKHRLTKVLPHIIDICLLLSGITMAISLSLSPNNQPWLMAKLIALFLYIGFGLLMIRYGKIDTRKWIGLIGGMSIYVYIVGVAHSKSIYSFLSL